MTNKPSVPPGNPLHLIPDESHRQDDMVLRTLPILLIPFVVGAAIGLLISVTVGAPPPRAGDPGLQWMPLIPIVVLAMFSTALILLVRVGQSKLSASLMIAVWTLVTTFFALENGVTSNWPALLLLPICTAGLLIDGAASISLAGVATLLILALGWLELQGMGLSSVPRVAAGSQPAPALLLSMSFWIGLFWAVAALTFLLARGQKRALDQSRLHAQALADMSAQLEERVTDQTAALLAQERESAMLEERARVARDIHDTLAQGLTGIVLQLGAAQRALSVAPTETKTHLDLAQKMAREALGEARRSIWNLRTPAVEGADLRTALHGLTMHPMRSGMQITFEQRGKAFQLSSNVESTLLRVCQEALVNVAKHSNATKAAVTLEYASDSIRLSICDNGVGFGENELTEPAQNAGPTGGFGLLGMRERVSALGGSLSLTNDAGARVHAVVPRKVVQSEPEVEATPFASTRNGQ